MNEMNVDRKGEGVVVVVLGSFRGSHIHLKKNVRKINSIVVVSVSYTHLTLPTILLV